MHVNLISGQLGNSAYSNNLVQLVMALRGGSTVSPNLPNAALLNILSAGAAGMNPLSQAVAAQHPHSAINANLLQAAALGSGICIGPGAGQPNAASLLAAASSALNPSAADQNTAALLAANHNIALLPQLATSIATGGLLGNPLAALGFSTNALASQQAASQNHVMYINPNDLNAAAMLSGAAGADVNAGSAASAVQQQDGVSKNGNIAGLMRAFSGGPTNNRPITPVSSASSAASMQTSTAANNAQSPQQNALMAAALQNCIAAGLGTVPTTATAANQK
ncbi:hypothetical protein Ciccas_008591 [Cichlidogyrus casuarinus]|uniref:Uncharacterized protein n=1 Tax=Cichlidogyrus casuarinus TaxID=1844966 RepID=A0ABD2PZJ9_9PLAT